MEKMSPFRKALHYIYIIGVIAIVFFFIINLVHGMIYPDKLVRMAHLLHHRLV